MYQEDTSTKPLLTPAEFHQRLHAAVGRNSVYALLRGGRIRHVRIGRKILIPATEVEAFPTREVEQAERNHGLSLREPPRRRA